MNDYLGNLVARSRNASRALRPQLAHPYETLGDPSGPVAAPFPEIAAPPAEEGSPGPTIAAVQGEASSLPGRATPPGRASTALAGEAAPFGHGEAANAKSSLGRAGAQTASPTISSTPPRASDPAAVQPREGSTHGETPRPLPAADATHATSHHVPRRETGDAPHGIGDANERGSARESHAPARGDEAQQTLAPSMPASFLPTPLDARQTREAEASPSHAAPDAEGATRVLRAEASLVASQASLVPSETSLPPFGTAAPSDGRPSRSAEPGVSARQDARALPLQVMSRPVASDLTRGAEPDPPAPTIRITIGRVEVRAVTPPPAPSRRPARPAPRMSLDEYLRSQNGGRG
jgi:hypothetical protein